METKQITSSLSLEIQPSELWEKIKAGDRYQIIDVREPSEYESVHIANSKLIPLSSLKQRSSEIDKDMPSYLLCHSDSRARYAHNNLSAMGIKNTLVIKGGLQGWLKLGYPVERGEGKVWSLERQVRFTAGVLVLVGIALAYTVSSTWICLSAFIALGMIVSAVTDTCGMAMVLTNMPWNKSFAKRC